MTVFTTFAVKSYPSLSPKPPSQWLHDYLTLLTRSLAKTNNMFTHHLTYLRQSVAAFGPWNLLLFVRYVLLYALPCAALALAAVRHRSSTNPGSPARLQRGSGRPARAVAYYYLGFIFTLPLIAVHLLLQFFAWVCLDVFAHTFRQKRRHGLLPLFYKSGDNNHNQQRQQQQEKQRCRSWPNCDCDYSIDSNGNISSPCLAIRVLKNYVELPPFRFFLEGTLRYDVPSQMLSSAAPDCSFGDWEKSDSSPAEPPRQRRQECSQVLQRWWTSQTARRQLHKKARSKTNAKKRKYDPKLSPVDESAELLLPLMDRERRL